MNLISNLTKIFKFFKPLKWAIIFQLFLIILFSTVALVWPYYFGKIIDSVTSGQSLQEVSKYLIMFAIFVFGTTIISLLRNVNEMRNIHIQTENILREVSLKKMTALSVGQHTRTDSGFKQSVLDQGKNAVGQIFFTLNYDVFPGLFRFLFIIGAIFFISPLIGVIVFTMSILQLSIYQFINLRQIGRLRKLRDHSNEVDRWNSEMIRIVSSIIFRGAEKRTLKDQNNKLNDLTKDFQGTWTHYEIKTGLISLVGDLSLIVMVILSVFSVISWQTLTIGAVVTLLTYGLRMVGIVESIYGSFRRLAFQWPQVEKFFEILEIENDIKEVKNPKVLPAKQNGYSIKFEDITFSHSNDDEKTDLKALDKVSFEINSGEVCAIVGRSGAGKTTIINLLLRAFDPDKGKIKIEDVDLKKLSLESHRKNIGIVEQEVILQNTTLRENILFGLSDEEKEKWTDEKLIELAKITRIDQFFDRLGEKPFEAVVGERGIKLSGGQRQRVGIARALSVNPEILIFDEATSSLDGENEKAIHDAMKDAFKNRTVIVIAHRLSTVRHADKIICMEKGKVVGIGNHEELYQTCPEYKSLVDIQSE
jgi:ABC-type multidrug transport system fused ATPase/permease subunit